MARTIKARILTAAVTRPKPHGKGRRVPGTSGKLQPISLDANWKELRYSTPRRGLRPRDVVECSIDGEGNCKILRVLPR